MNLFRSLGLTAYLSGAIFLLVVGMIFALIEMGSRGEEIKNLERDLNEAARWQESALERIAAAEALEGVSAAEAARLCQAAGNSAFDRGVAFGEAKGRLQCEPQS